jgi:hypothetical protein
MERPMTLSFSSSEKALSLVLRYLFNDPSRHRCVGNFSSDPLADGALFGLFAGHGDQLAGWLSGNLAPLPFSQARPKILQTYFCLNVLVLRSLGSCDNICKNSIIIFLQEVVGYGWLFLCSPE